jgi:hypothetical protein
MKNKLILSCLGGVVLLLCATAPVFAEGIEAESDNVLLDASPLAAGSRIQFIRGTRVAPGNTGPDYLGGSNTLVSTLEIGDGKGGAAGKFYLLNGSETGAPLYFRIWSAPDPAAGIKYGNSTQMTPSGAGSPPTYYNFASIILNLYAAAPAPPTMTSSSGIGYDSASVWWTASGTTERTSFTVSWGTAANAEGAPGSPQPVNNPNANGYAFNQTLDPGLTYYVKVRANNNFGSSGWSNIISFTTRGTGYGGDATNLKIKLDEISGGIAVSWEGTGLSYEVWSADLDGPFTRAATLSSTEKYYGGNISDSTERYFQVRVVHGQSAPEVVGWYTFNLSKEAGGTGINSFFIPLDTNVSGNYPLLTTASSVEDSVNNQGGTFDFLGGWNRLTQSEYAYLAGSPATDFALNEGEGYQISVSANTSWVVVGQKK